MLSQYRTSRGTRVGRCQQALGQYRTSRSIRVGRKHHTLHQYRTSHSMRSGALRRYVSTGHRIGECRKIAGYARSVPDTA
eukprot:3632126-Rhodomonas_salina.2